MPKELNYLKENQELKNFSIKDNKTNTHIYEN